VGTQEWAHDAGRLRHLPGLHRDQHQVHRTDGGWVVRGADGTHGEVAGDAADPESPFSKSRQVRPAGDEGDFLARLCQATAEVSSDAPASEDRDSQGYPPGGMPSRFSC
jgi:hypothetical protein